MTREPVSKKLRFEAFKRDKFTCQYCGAKAPDVVLNADHIKPVAADGPTTILNLITACFACNSGKGKRLLDDDSVVVRQRQQIEEAEIRREQLEMMLRWRDQVESERVDLVKEIEKRIADRGGYYLNDSGRQTVRLWLKRYDLATLLVAIDESFDIYMRWEGDLPISRAFDVALSKVPAQVRYQGVSKTKPYMQKLAYIQGILRIRCRDQYMKILDELEVIHIDKSVPLDVIESAAKRVNDFDDFVDAMHAAVMA